MSACTIELRRDGPIVVRGATHFLDSQGKELPLQEALFLCRCGRSGAKPMCDGTHKRVGWREANPAAAAEPED